MMAEPWEREYDAWKAYNPHDWREQEPTRCAHGVAADEDGRCWRCAPPATDAERAEYAAEFTSARNGDDIPF